MTECEDTTPILKKAANSRKTILIKINQYLREKKLLLNLLKIDVN